MKNPLIKKNMAVVVLGFGITGRAAAKYLHEVGAKVYVSDARSEAQLSSIEKDLIADCCVGFEGGGHTAEFVKQGELIFVSPGISTGINALQDAIKNSIPLIGELALAAPALKCKVVAITGTNGKTTVTTLIGELLKKTGKKVFVGGNIGRPLLECVMALDDSDVAVVEVSSFQLELSGTFRPDVAVLLNITPDHLDRHGTISEYILAKAQIFAAQQKEDVAIISSDNLLCLELAGHLDRVKPLFFGHSRECRAYICESEIYLRWKDGVEIYDLENTVFDNYIGRQNSAAAILAARSSGCDRNSIQEGLMSFQALPHRMQMVDTIAGVYYCNDSKATNTGAVLSALQQVKGKVVLIAGGRDKGDDYGLLKTIVQKRVKKVILIGEAAERIANELKCTVDIAHAVSMEDAVALAGKCAQKGDTVLLSPACASFDMFDSYGHRGQVFIDAVKRLKMQASVTV